MHSLHSSPWALPYTSLCVAFQIPSTRWPGKGAFFCSWPVSRGTLDCKTGRRVSWGYQVKPFQESPIWLNSGIHFKLHEDPSCALTFRHIPSVSRLRLSGFLQADSLQGRVAVHEPRRVLDGAARARPEEREQVPGRCLPWHQGAR